VPRQTRRAGPLLTGADWVQAALAAIAEGGLAAVAVEPLARRLGATKGSFYWHFPTRDALIAAALKEWERAETDAPIQRLEVIRDPAERLRAVTLAAVTDRAGGLRDAALSASADHPLVKPVLERVTAHRLRFLTDAYQQLGWPPPQAAHRALLLYTPYVGLFHYLRAAPGPTPTDAELHAYADDLVAALVTRPQA
jgi:AcrR family transcriptional regulator